MKPKKMKKFILWAVLILVVVAPGAVLAEEAAKPAKLDPAPSIWDSLVPEGEKKVGNVTVEYEIYPLSHYQLDLWVKDRSIWDFIAHPIEETTGQAIDGSLSMLHLFVNMGWQITVELSRIVIWILEESLKLDIVDELIEYVGDGVRNLAGFNGNLQERGFYGLMLPIVTVIFAGYAGYKGMRENDEFTVVGAILSFLLIVLGSFAFFYYVEDIARELNKFGTEFGKGLMALTTNTFQPTKLLNSEEATVQAGNNVWDITVITPFKLLEFGTTEVDEKRVRDILKTPPEERGELLNRERNVYKNQMILPSNVAGRAAGVALFFLMNLFIWSIPIFIAIYKLVYQGWFLIVLLMGPIALAWAVVPAWREILYKWASELLGAVLMQVALGMMLAIYLAVGGALFQFGEEKGYLLMVLLQIVLVITIFKQRKMIFSFVIAPATFLHWNAASHKKYPAWAPLSPHRLGHLFEGAFSSGLIDDARDLVKGMKQKASMGSLNTKQKDSRAKEDIPELKEMEKNKEEVIFEPYDDPQLSGKEQDKLGGSSMSLLEMDGKDQSNEPPLLEEEKPLMLDGVNKEPEVIDADYVPFVEGGAGRVESRQDAPLLLEVKERKKEAKAKEEGPILLIEPRDDKKEGRNRNDR